MKRVFIISLLTLLVYSCKKTATDPAPTSTNSHTLPDTGEYVTFTLQGDSFNNVIFDLIRQKGQTGQFGGNFSGERNIMIAQTPANGYDISNYYAFSRKQTGTVMFDSLNNISILMSSSKDIYFLKSSSGRLQISHYPASIGDYIKGSFSGQFIDLYSNRTFTISNGLFRIYRTE